MENTKIKGQLSIETIAKMIEDLTITDIKTWVEVIWLDFGAKIKGKNIIVEYGEYGQKRSYQLLSPAQLNNIKNGSMDINDIFKIVDEINKRGW
jgi:hypothetical protein